MNLEKLKEVFYGQSPFRLKAAKQLIFRSLVGDWNEATSLPIQLREKLNQECPLLIKAKTFLSRDGFTVKGLITLTDGLKIETVLMRPPGGRFTVCVSSQVGCPLGCLFCATGGMGFKRNLSTEEIVEQVIFFARYLKKVNQKVTNVVFMGMGEPFLNYQNVSDAIQLINDEQGMSIGSRHISISTAGVIPGINKFAQQPSQANLAISLHAPNDQLRTRLMPITSTYPLQPLIAAVSDYLKKTNRKVMFEYLMLAGVNDRQEQAVQLINLLKTISSPLYMVNLIRYNLIATGAYRPSSEGNIKKFKDLLQRSGIETTRRYNYGEDINAACGQLAARPV